MLLQSSSGSSLKCDVFIVAPDALIDTVERRQLPQQLKCPQDDTTSSHTSDVNVWSGHCLIQASRSAPTRTGALAGFDPQRPDAYHMTGGSLAQWFDVIVHRQAVAPGARCSRDTARRPGTEWCRAAHDVGTSPCAATAPVIAGRPTAADAGTASIG
jgi:hypothetical protein